MVCGEIVYILVHIARGTDQDGTKYSVVLIPDIKVLHNKVGVRGNVTSLVSAFQLFNHRVYCSVLGQRTYGFITCTHLQASSLLLHWYNWVMSVVIGP
jgi:hypothetical protein